MSAAGAHLKGAQARSEQNGIPELAAHVHFCQLAEACGIEHLLTAFGFHRADPVALASALGVLTEKVNFLVAARSGVAAPTLFAQQINTISALTNGRVCINIVAGHSPQEFRYYGDFLSPDERYDRTDEFLTVLRGFWEGDGPVHFNGKYYQVEGGILRTPFVSDTRSSPEIYLGGKSERAFELAALHASCLLTMPEAPETLAPKIQALLRTGTEVGLLVSVLARQSKEEAVTDAYAMIASLGSEALKTHRDFRKGSVSEAFNSALALGEREEDWLCPWLWTGAVPYLGAPSVAIVGSYDAVACAIMEYKRIGVSQFLFMGWPDEAEMSRFGAEVLPRVRALETAQSPLVLNKP